MHITRTLFYVFQCRVLNLKSPDHPRAYSCRGVIRELPVRPLHHLIAVVVCVQGHVVLQGGAGSEDDLRVEAERSQRIRLLQPVTRQSAPKALWDTGGDGEGVVLIAFLSRKTTRITQILFFL